MRKPPLNTTNKNEPQPGGKNPLPIVNGYGDTKLHLAAYKGDCAQLAEILADHPEELERPNNHGRLTPLHFAVGHDHLEAVELLLVQGANPEALTHNHETALHLAAARGHVEIIDRLVAQGANLSAIDGDGSSMLSTALEKGHLKASQRLIALGADCQYVYQGNSLLHQVMITAYDKKSRADYWKNCPIRRARLAEVIPFLLLHGVDLNLPNRDGTTALHLAVIADDRETCAYLLEQGATVDRVDGNRASPLHYAAEHGYEALFEQLLANGANPLETDENGKSVLQYAAVNGHTKIVSRLLEMGVDPNEEDNDGKTALDHAASKLQQECFKVLLAQGATPGKKSKACQSLIDDAKNNGLVEVLTLFEAALTKQQDESEQWWHVVESGDSDAIKQCLAEDKDLNRRDRYGKTALHRGARQGDLDTVQWLVEQGADVNIKDNFGKTALHRAGKMGHLDVVKYLFEHGAEIDGQQYYSEQLLFKLLYEDFETIKALLDSGIDLQCKDTKGDTLLSRATWAHRGDLVSYLIDNSVNLEQKNKDGTVALLKCSSHKLDMIRQLLEAGADPNALDRDGATVLFLCGSTEMAECLFDHGADPNIQSVKRHTALHEMQVLDKAQVVACFLAHGANPNMVDKCSVSPLYIATEHQTGLDTIRHLLNYGAKPDIQVTGNIDATAIELGKRRGYQEYTDLLETAQTARKYLALACQRSLKKDDADEADASEELDNLLRAYQVLPELVLNYLDALFTRTHTRFAVGSPDPDEMVQCVLSQLATQVSPYKPFLLHLAKRFEKQLLDPEVEAIIISSDCQDVINIINLTLVCYMIGHFAHKDANYPLLLGLLIRHKTKERVIGFTTNDLIATYPDEIAKISAELKAFYQSYTGITLTPDVYSPFNDLVIYLSKVDKHKPLEVVFPVVPELQPPAPEPKNTNMNSSSDGEESSEESIYRISELLEKFGKKRSSSSHSSSEEAGGRPMGAPVVAAP